MSEWVWRNEDGEVVGREEVFDPIAVADEHVLEVRFSDTKPVRSECPHPLVTVDFDAEGNVVAIEFVGPVKETVCNPQPFKPGPKAA